MSLDTTIVGSNLDAGSNVKTALSLDPVYMGGVRLFSENDPGDVTGTPFLRSPETSADYRIRTGMDSVWDTEDFTYTTQNYNKHKYVSTTLTAVWTTGALNLNGGGVVGAGGNAVQVQTYRSFPLLGSGAVYFETAGAFSNTIGANINVDFGGFLPAATGAGIPLDGCYFRANSAGVNGIINVNGTEIPVTFAQVFIPASNRVYKYLVAIAENEVEFWIDDVLYARADRPTNAGAVMMGGSVPWAVRQHNTGTGGSIVQFKVASYSVTLGDLNNNRLWASVMAGQGGSGILYPSGGTAGQTANNANSTVPATATLSNTAAGYATLGGKFVFAAIVGAETDYALFAFLNPTPSTSLTGKNLVIRGVWIDTFNAVVAVATAPTVLEWSLAVGSTAVSLATTDGAATRLPKRIALGIQSFVVGDLAGKQANRVDVNLDAPVVVEPGTYAHIILRIPYGAATATELFRGQVGINAYWE